MPPHTRAVLTRVLRTALAALAALLVIAPAAFAETRTGAASDPQDQPENLNGPRKPDIEQVRVSFDTAGSINAVIRFYEPIGQSASGYKFEVVVAEAEAADSYFAGQCKSYSGARIFGFISSSSTAASMTVTGYDGTASVPQSISADGREIMLATSHGALAGKDYRCSTAEVYVPDEYGHCNYDCSRILYRYTYDTVDTFYFGGFHPPACNDRIDNDGDGKADHLNGDPGCTSAGDTDETDPPPASAPKSPAPSDGDTDAAVETLTKADATSYARSALRQKFKANYRSGYARRVSCGRRTRLSFGCKVSWVVGDLAYWGTVRIWYRADPADDNWYYSLRVRRFDEYCAAVRRAKRCTKLYVVK